MASHEADDVSDTYIVKSGWCVKLGAIFKTWRKRWFVLTPHEMRYFVAPGRQQKGTIDISGASAALDPKCKRQPAFAVRTARRTFQIVTEGPSEAQDWVRVITDAVNACHEKVRLEDFQILKVIGQGSYGKVRLVQYTRTGQLYAMKSLSKKKLVEFDLTGRTFTERNLLVQANHPFIVSARWAFQTDTKAILVMDYLPGGELWRRLREEKRFSESRTRLYAAELVLAIDYLHTHGVIHRDLKLENILFDQEGHLHVTDFGLIKEKMLGGTTKTFCGTPQYIAPEIIAQTPYNHMVDWWSLGVLVYEMLYGVPPFYNQNESRMFQAIVQTEPPYREGPSFEAILFVKGLLAKSPSQRLGAEPAGVMDIKGHPFFQTLDWEKVLRKEIPMEWVPQMRSETDTAQFMPEFTEMPVEMTPDPDLGQAFAPHLRNFTMTSIRPRPTPEDLM
jgi:serine/threonine protein kinase